MPSETPIRKPVLTGAKQMCQFPRRILIADHHTERLPEIGPELAAAGHTVFHAHDVVSSLETIAKRRPDLIVLAPLTRTLGGPEIRRVLRVKDRAQHTSLLLVTDDDQARGAIHALGHRVDDVLPRSDATAGRLIDRILLALGRLMTVRGLEEEKRSLERQSITDFKTGTFNDRYFHRRLREEFSRARRQGAAISCLMLDFDNFKEINDTFDHAFGDFVLLAFAKKLRSIIRDIDIPARFGGDEFVILLPNTGLDEAVAIAERIRSIVGAYAFEHQGLSTSVGLSIGIATFDGIEGCTPDEILRRADCALLEAKRRGRNRVVLYPQIENTEAARLARRRVPRRNEPPREAEAS